MTNKQEKIDSRISDFLDRFQKSYKSPDMSSSAKKIPLNESAQSGGKLNPDQNSSKGQISKISHSFLSSIQNQNSQPEGHSPITKFLDGYKTSKGRYLPAQSGKGSNPASIGTRHGLIDTKRKLKFIKSEENKKTETSSREQEEFAENQSPSPEQKTLNTQESSRSNNHNQKSLKQNPVKATLHKNKNHQNQIQTLLKTRSLSPPASLKQILSQEYKTLNHEKNKKIEDKEEMEEVINDSKVDKSERKSFGASKIFAESSKKIASLENNQLSKENFDEEVKDLISLIKKEKQVIVNDMTHLSKQMHKYKKAYKDLKIKFDCDKPSYHQNNLGSRFSLPVSNSILTKSAKEKNTQISEDSNDSSGTLKKEVSTQYEIDDFNNETEKDLLGVTHRDSGFVTRDQARRASSIDPRQLKLVGALLSTLNVDKSLNVKINNMDSKSNEENEQSIFSMVSKLTKDEMIELQLIVIQNLVDQINVGEKEK